MGHIFISALCLGYISVYLNHLASFNLHVFAALLLPTFLTAPLFCRQIINMWINWPVIIISKNLSLQFKRGVMNIEGNINEHALELAMWQMWLAEVGISWRMCCLPGLQFCLQFRYGAFLCKLVMGFMKMVTSLQHNTEMDIVCILYH